MKHLSFFIGILLVFSQCIQNSKSSPSGVLPYSPPAVTGTLLEADGITPAAGVNVILYSRNSTASISSGNTAKKCRNVLNTATDINGVFSLDSCDSGMYAIDGIAQGNFGIRIDSILLDGQDSPCQLAPHRLRENGAVKGVVYLADGGDPHNVFILLFGSDRFVQVSSDGTFQIDNLPYGNYELKCVCSIDNYSRPVSIPVTVIPDDTISVDSVILIPDAAGLPQNVSFTYDTNRQEMALEWDPALDTDIIGYNVYFYIDNFEEQYRKLPVNRSIIAGKYTFFDTLTNHDEIMEQQYYVGNYAHQRTAIINDSLFEEEAQFTMVYGICGVYADGTEGRKCNPVKISTVSPFTAYALDQSEIDTIRLLPLYIEWSSDEELVVVYTTKESYYDDIPVITIVTYGNDLALKKQTAFERPVREPAVTIDNDKLYITDYPGILYCYTLDGTFLSTSTLPVSGTVTGFDVRNDTIMMVARSHDGGTESLQGFSVHGTPLFNIGEVPSIELKIATNEICYLTNFYDSFRGADSLGECMELNFPSLEMTPCFAENRKDRSFFIADANQNDILLIQEWTGSMQLCSRHGELQYRIPYCSCSRRPKVKYVSINNKGQIAVCSGGYLQGVHVLRARK
jgi:hypothetical protein